MGKAEKSVKKLFITGIILILMGISLLLVTTKTVTLKEFKIIWPAFIIIIGLWFQWKAFFRKDKEIYILLGMFLTLSGIYIFLATNLLKIHEIRKIWPFFMLFSGISLLPYALKKKTKEQRIAIFVPSAAIIMLSLFFLFFSFKLSKIKFLPFAAVWWPAGFIIMGFIIIAIFIIKIHRQKKSE